MRASEAISRLPSGVMEAFRARLPTSLAGSVVFPDRTTSELREELADAKREGRRDRHVELFARNFRKRQGAASSAGQARIEENYFYSSRRFPVITTNTIGSGALAANTYPFFTKGVNDDGSGLGFPTGFTLGLTETNLEVGGGIPQGSSFVFNQLGITFDTDIATADLAVMMDACTLAFAKSGGQFSLNHGPLKMWPGGMGIEGYAAAAVGGTPLAQTAAHNGSADIRAVRTLRIPRILREKEAFQYAFVVTRATKAKDGSTIALSNFVVPTIWLFGGQRNVIPT